MSSKWIDFGFNPSESQHHFYVVVPKDQLGEIKVYERFSWDDGEQKIRRKDILKVTISKHKWKNLSSEVATTFNARLKADKLHSGRFTMGGTAVGKLFGKELMILLWAIEHNDPAGIPTALRNWRGLMPEERWWLYTMTNASTGKCNDKKGWRMALRYALCENPVDEPMNQVSLFDLLGDEKDE